MASVPWILTLAFCLFALNWDETFTTEIQVDRVELLNSTFSDGIYNISELRVTKFNRTSYVLNLDAEIFFDVDQSVDAELTLHHNRMNNNEYNKMPFGLAKKSLCTYLEKYYKSILMEPMKNISNSPQLGPKDNVCPIPKVIFN